MSKDELFMKRALDLAAFGGFNVSPNPLVGAVIVKNGKIIAEGYHEKFGENHAEINAISTAKRKNLDLKGATFYVNLEPCVHFDGKKTGSCTDAISESGISRVIVAMRDPNPKVSGKGIYLLKRRGIKVEVGCLKALALKLNRKFIKWVGTGIPFVAMKVAMSLDGKIATKTGDSKWITSEKSREFVHELRDGFDAILVGINTVIKDNPALVGKKHEPLRIVLDSSLRIPNNSNVLRDNNVILITTDVASSDKIKALRKRGVRVEVFPKKHSLASLLRFFGKNRISSLFVEGGAEIFGSFIDEKLVDKYYWFISPKIIGGGSAKSAVGGNGINKIKDAVLLKNRLIKDIDGDLLIEADDLSS